MTALVLDRFVELNDGWALDLATAGRVRLRRTTSGDPPLERRRSAIAAQVSTLRIPGMATLVDYGPDGRHGWAEAYRLGTDGSEGGRPQPQGPHDAEKLLARAGCVYAAHRHRSWSDWTRAEIVPVPLECVDLTEPAGDAVRRRASGTRAVIGTAIQRRDELDPVLELMNDGSARTSMLGIGATPGAGLTTFLDALAAEARRAGFVPVSSGLCAEGFLWPPGLDSGRLTEQLRRRHVVVLDERRATGSRGAPSACASDVARFLARLDLAGGRPHIIVSAGPADPDVPLIALGPMPAATLRRSVLCDGIDGDRLDRAIAEAIRESGGWPGRFALLLSRRLGAPNADQPYRTSGRAAALVREAAEQQPEGPAIEAAHRLETAVVYRRARDLAERGRHAAAERLLKRAAGFFRRRKLVQEAARAQLVLGRLHVARGRRAAAREAFEESRCLSDSARDGAGVLRALLHLGAVLIDEGSLAAAESALRTAEVGATHAKMAGLARAAGLLLARCLFWQGQHEAAWSLAGRLASPAQAVRGPATSVAERAENVTGSGSWGEREDEAWLPAELPIVAADIGVRVALMNRDAGQAAKRLAAAGTPHPQDDPAQFGGLCALGVLVQGALGNTEAVARQAAAGLDVMRRRHAPVAAQEIRLARIQALVEAGDRTKAARHLHRLADHQSPIMSGLARVRLDELSMRLSESEGPAEFGPAYRNTPIDTGAVLRILQQCQDAEDDEAAVAGVCEAVRSSVGAAAVSAYLVAGGAVRPVASVGGRGSRADLAARCAAALLAIGPEETTAGREAAAPVSYCGAAVGVIAARWAPAAQVDDARARGVLAAAAAALGPAMAALGAPASGEAGDDSGIGELSGQSAAMTALRLQVTRAAAAPFPVLITGESGTGKELIARAVHARSVRRPRRFCAVNCAAIGDDLFETELFGHARGAFTGAASDRPGLFEEADGGTLFLDEVGELSPRAQAKLLRAIQEGEVRRVGENHSRRVDTRIVAASNRLLADEVRAGRFRHDLLYRLDVVRISVPPLRERPEDVAPLALRFWRDATRRTGGQAELSPATLAALARYDWPGNVRELQNTLAALAVQAPARGRVGPSRLPEAIIGAGGACPAGGLTLTAARRRFEERFVRATLARTGGHRAEAAAALGLSRQGLAKLMARLGIEAAEREGAADVPA